MEDVKKGAVLRAEEEHENRGAIWILGSSIGGIMFWWG
jgi:hypothetical protein